MSAPRLTRSLVQELRSARTHFGAPAARRKVELLQRCEECEMTAPRVLCAYHDVLLYLEAHADSARVESLARKELGRLAEAAAAIAATDRGEETLSNSGIAGTAIDCAFTLDMTEWLLDRFPGTIDVAWDDESGGDGLDDLLFLCAPSVERDGLLASEPSTRRWLELASGPASRSPLGWITKRMRDLRCPPEVLDHVFEAIDLRVRWTLTDSIASITFNRFPARPTFHHRGRLRRRVTLRSLLRRPIPPPAPVTARTAETLITAARYALLTRCRETDPVTYANPHDVQLVRLDRGIDVAVIGMLPARRLPIESFFGYVLAKNRVPAAYGGAWVFDDRAAIGINVFDAFRGGESSYLFGQVLRVYQQLFDVRRFVVDPYQFGAGNEDGIRSGAFWFYYRLGFRPTEATMRELALSEWTTMQSDPRHRSSRATLRRLATGDLALDVGRVSGPAHERMPELRDVALAVTAAVGRRFGGNRARAERWAPRHVRSALGADERRGWSADERTAFDRLSLLVALLPGLHGWTAAEKRAMVRLMRAKGGVRERDYAAAVRRHDALQSALRMMIR